MNKYTISAVLVFMSFFQLTPMNVPVANKKISVTVHNHDPRKVILYVLAPDENFIPQAGDYLLSHLTEHSLGAADKITIKMPERSALEIVGPDGLYFVRRSYNQISISKKPLFEAQERNPEYAFPFTSKELNGNPVDIFYRGAGVIDITLMPKM